MPKKQIHLFLTDRTHEALSCCAHDLGCTRTYVVKRALQVFLLKGDYFRKAGNNNGR